MFCPSETAYEEIRRRQRDLQEQAARAQLRARSRREAALAGPQVPRRQSWLARRFRANLARP